MNSKFPDDPRPALRLQIAEQKLVADAAQRELTRLEHEFEEVERLMPIVWVMVAKKDERDVRFAHTSRFKVELCWLSSNNYQEYFTVEEWTVEKAKEFQIKYYED